MSIVLQLVSIARMVLGLLDSVGKKEISEQEMEELRRLKLDLLKDLDGMIARYDQGTEQIEQELAKKPPLK